MTAWTPVELLLTGAARALWPVMQGINRTLPDRPFHPRWAPRPLLKSQERSRPPLGWPRHTDSLCPACVREARARILARRAGHRHADSRATPARFPRRFVERDGPVVIEKTCPSHGTFTRHARHRPRVPPAHRVPLSRPRLHGRRRRSAQSRHLVDQVRARRGADRRPDEPLQHDVRPVLHGREPGRLRPRARRWTRSRSSSTTRSAIKPRRQMSVQFSGGEPTLSPLFLDAVRYAREVGYFSVQCATNGIRFAQEPDFARQARDAGPPHRLPAVRRRRQRGQRAPQGRQPLRRQAARDREPARRPASTSASSSPSSTPSTTTRSGRSSSSRSRTATRSPSSRSSRCRSPAATKTSPTRTAHAQRYTLSHLAHDLQAADRASPSRCATGSRCRRPASFSDVTDLMQGPSADWGSLKCGCHPNCGIGTAFMVSKKTNAWAPLASFIDVEQMMHDARTITDAARSPRLDEAADRARLLRNYRPTQSAEGLPADRSAEEIRQAERRSARRDRRAGRRRAAKTTSGGCSSSPACGSRISSTTTSAAPRCASSPTARRWARSRSAPTTPASAGGRSSRRCTRTPPSPSGTRTHGKHAVYANPRKAVPLPVDAQPVALKIPRDGRLVDWEPQPQAEPGRCRTRSGPQRRLTTNAGT